MWILGNARREIMGFYGLSLLTIASYPAWKDQLFQTAIIFIAAILVDTSHVYATLWRTWFSKDEMKRAAKIHLLLPVIILLVCFSWCYFGLPYFWTAVLYLTVFHHIRQYYGVYRWSESLNLPKGSDFSNELYALTTLPFIGYHFRSDIVYQGFFVPDDMLRLPNQMLFYAVWVTIIISLASIVFKIFKSYQTRTIRVPTLSTVLIPSFIHIFCFMISTNFFLSLLPVLAIHGMTYYHLTALAKQRTNAGIWQHYRLGLTLIILISIMFGISEHFFTDIYIDLNNSQDYRGHFLLALGAAFVTTPAIYHYIIDGILWKHTHPEFKTVLGRN